MAYSKESHELLEKAFQVLKTKVDYPYARMVGLLIPNVPLSEAKRIAKMIEEMEGEK